MIKGVAMDDLSRKIRDAAKLLAANGVATIRRRLLDRPWAGCSAAVRIVRGADAGAAGGGAGDGSRTIGPGARAVHRRPRQAQHLGGFRRVRGEGGGA